MAIIGPKQRKFDNGGNNRSGNYEDQLVKFMVIFIAAVGFFAAVCAAISGHN